jgi:hypothetical protein
MNATWAPARIPIARKQASPLGCVITINILIQPAFIRTLIAAPRARGLLEGAALLQIRGDNVFIFRHLARIFPLDSIPPIGPRLVLLQSN